MSEQAERYTSIDLDWMFCREKVPFRSMNRRASAWLRNGTASDGRHRTGVVRARNGT